MKKVAINKSVILSNPYSLLAQQKISPKKQHAQAIPDSQFFQSLKMAEKKQFVRSRRKCLSYQDNITAALQLPGGISDLKSPHAKIEFSKNHIIEHANRRVDLFFYTLISYYKTQFFPTLGHTNLQHGKGSRNVTQACHSSMTPSLLDKSIYESNPNKIPSRSLLTGTHFMDSLNSTVELPDFVNKLDFTLEELCREECLTFIRKTSLGVINPVEGLTLFLKLMHQVLHDLQLQEKNKYPFLQFAFFTRLTIQSKLLHLFVDGTFSTTYSPETESIAEEYIHLLLRMTPTEKTLCAKSEKRKEQLYEKKFIEIQEEILNTKTQVLR